MRDAWYITRRSDTGQYAAVFVNNYDPENPPGPPSDPKYLFDTLGEAINYASKNYVTLGIVLDPNL